STLNKGAIIGLPVKKSVGEGNFSVGHLNKFRRPLFRRDVRNEKALVRLPDRTAAAVNLVSEGVNDSVKPRRRDRFVENFLFDVLVGFLHADWADEVSENESAFLRVGEIALELDGARLYPDFRGKSAVNYEDSIPETNSLVVVPGGPLKVDYFHFVRDDRDLVLLQGIPSLLKENDRVLLVFEINDTGTMQFPALPIRVSELLKRFGVAYPALTFRLVDGVSVRGAPFDLGKV